MTRELAIKILSTRDNQGMPITWQNGFIEAYDLAIEALERKHGAWKHSEIIDDDSSTGVSDAAECSVCGHHEDWYWARTYYNYCPNCGADMKGEKEPNEME